LAVILQITTHGTVETGRYSLRYTDGLELWRSSSKSQPTERWKRGDIAYTLFGWIGTLAVILQITTNGTLPHTDAL
jgi:hypothetical protein